MLGVETATVRKWEDRYGVVVPARSKGDQRVYSRDELEQLRFVVDLVERGTTPAEAHRLLVERSRGEASSSGDDEGVRIMVLLAERDRYAAELLEYFLRTEGYEVCVALEPERAERLFVERRPRSVDHRADDVGRRPRPVRPSRRRRGSPVLAMSALDLSDQAMAAGASAFLAKPVVPLQFVSTVRDLLGSSASTRPSKSPSPDATPLDRQPATRRDPRRRADRRRDHARRRCTRNRQDDPGRTVPVRQRHERNDPGVYLSTVSEPFDKLLRFGQALSFFDIDADRALGVLRRPRRRRASATDCPR